MEHRTEFCLASHSTPCMLLFFHVIEDFTELLFEFISFNMVWTRSLIYWMALTTPLSPTHLKAGFRLLDIWVLWIKPIDYSTLAMSYNLLILVLRSFSSWTSPSEIYFAASSRDRTVFQVTKSSMNRWQKLPSDFTFLYLGVLRGWRLRLPF